LGDLGTDGEGNIIIVIESTGFQVEGRIHLIQEKFIEHDNES
jgi:hypothetical protein